uniref:Uncharacterized protein n=1 Tax=Arundo donax TaxID=35708 RepID=A0A0A9EZ75_ARUDO
MKTMMVSRVHITDETVGTARRRYCGNRENHKNRSVYRSNSNSKFD